MLQVSQRFQWEVEESRKLLKEAEGFLNPIEVQGAGSMQPLTKSVSEGINDAGEAVSRTIPMRRITTHGDEITEKYVPGGTTKEWRPTGDLESIIRRRAALGSSSSSSSSRN